MHMLELLQKIQARVQNLPGDLPNKAIRLIGFYEKCRTEKCGGMLHRCPTCNEHAIQYFACNKRGCPICGGKNQAIWFQKTSQRLLNTQHFHVVFSVPNEITICWLKNKRVVTKDLFAAANRALARYAQYVGLEMGWILCFQSLCQGMAYKTHIHAVITAGGIRDGTWQAQGDFNATHVSREFERACQGLENTRCEHRHGAYSAYLAGAVRDARSLLLYLAFKTIGIGIPKDRQFRLDESKDQISFHEGMGCGRIERQIPVELFLERYFNHVPEHGLVVIRSYGLYSNRRRNKYEIAKALLPEREPGDSNTGLLCTSCFTLMKILFLIKAFERWNYKKYGFGPDPPVHGQRSLVA